MKRTGGITLLMLLVLALLVYRSRDALLIDGPPAFFPEEPSGIFLLLGEGFSRPGIHQFSDDMTLSGVIALTVSEGAVEICKGINPEFPLQSGEFVECVAKEGICGCFRRGWMPASMRMALGIRLHPDRMERDDWEVLPGIGPRLAERIEIDRQLNGDFEVYTNLQRVRGIGPQRIQSWEEFFLEH